MVLCCVFASVTPVFSHSGRPFGLGVVVGEPSGITGKYWLDGRSAVDVKLAYSLDHFMLVTGDYLLHFDNLMHVNGQHLHPYVGVGGIFAFAAGTSAGKGFAGSSSSSLGMGIRVPFGIDWTLSATPLSVFVEIAPGVGIIPSTFGIMDGGLGIRYFF